MRLCPVSIARESSKMGQVLIEGKFQLL